jgi:hypothetical protein
VERQAKNEKYEMSYTELWEAVGNKKVKRVEYCRDRSALVATLHEDAGHGLSHRVMMPFDPELFDYLIDNNVEVKSPFAVSLRKPRVRRREGILMRACMGPCAGGRAAEVGASYVQRGHGAAAKPDPCTGCTVCPGDEECGAG